MPVYKKRRVVAKKRAPKRSYAMVPRPRLNGELAHRHIVTCSTSTGTGGAQLFIRNIGGTLDFGTGIYASPNMALSWSLANMVVGIGGNVALTIPVPNVAELQQLYDTFQIEKVEWKMFFSKSEAFVTSEASGGINQVMPLVGHAPDADDAANTGITQLQQYSTYKVHQSTQPLMATTVPCSAGATFDPTAGGVPASLGFTRLQRQDINVAYADTPHYGHKFAVDGFRASAVGDGFLMYVSIQARIHFLMKATR